MQLWRGVTASTELAKQFNQIQVADSYWIIKSGKHGSGSGGGIVVDRFPVHKVWKVPFGYLSMDQYKNWKYSTQVSSDLLLMPNENPTYGYYINWDDSRLEALWYPHLVDGRGWPLTLLDPKTKRITIWEYYRRILYGHNLAKYGSLGEQYLIHGYLRIETSKIL